jgi:hypothetical protein
MERYTHDVNGTTKHVTALTYAEVIDSAKEVVDSDLYFRDRCSSIHGDYSFTGTRSLEEAIELAEHGWAEGLERVDGILRQVEAELGFLALPSTVAPEFDVAGEEPDIDRFLAGEPENMTNYTPFEGRKVSLAINAAQHCFVDKDLIINRGVGILAAFNYLSANGYQCSIGSFDYTSNGGGFYGRTRGHHEHETFVEILSSNQFYDLDKLSFAITHSSFLRRLLFAQNELEDSEIRDIMGYHSGGGYGRPEDPIELDSLSPQDNEEVIIFTKDEGLVPERRIVDFSLDIISQVKSRFDPDSAQDQPQPVIIEGMF